MDCKSMTILTVKSAKHALWLEQEAKRLKRAIPEIVEELIEQEMRRRDQDRLKNTTE